MELANRRGYYISEKCIFYIEYDSTGNVSFLSGWPNDAAIDIGKKDIARKELYGEITNISEMIYMLPTAITEIKFVVVQNGGIRILDCSIDESYLILHPTDADYYSRLYINEINKYLPRDQQDVPISFWKKMALDHEGISIQAAIDYIENHVDEFKVDCWVR